MSRPALPADGRSRRRVEAMRRVQDAALDLVEACGYAAITVEEIATAAGVGPATVYRNFETKEQVILWDEYDPLLLSGIEARLRDEPLLRAVTTALGDSLDAVYRSDKRRILRRATLIFSEPDLKAAAAVGNEGLRSALESLFRKQGSTKDPLAAAVAAAAIVATLETAVRRWVEDRGRTPMRDVLEAAFEALARMGQTAATHRHQSA